MKKLCIVTAFEIETQTVHVAPGNGYLATEVEAALAEKDEEIKRLGKISAEWLHMLSERDDARDQLAAARAEITSLLSRFGRVTKIEPERPWPPPPEKP